MFTYELVADLNRRCHNDNTRKFEDRLALIEAKKRPFIFSSVDLISILMEIPSVNTRLALVSAIGPRLSDPRAKLTELVDLFRFAEEKAKVAEVLKARATVLAGSAFMASNQTSSSVSVSSSYIIESADATVDSMGIVTPSDAINPVAIPASSHDVLPSRSRAGAVLTGRGGAGRGAGMRQMPSGAKTATVPSSSTVQSTQSLGTAPSATSENSQTHLVVAQTSLNSSAVADAPSSGNGRRSTYTSTSVDRSTSIHAFEIVTMDTTVPTTCSRISLVQDSTSIPASSSFEGGDDRENDPLVNVNTSNVTYASPLKHASKRKMKEIVVILPKRSLRHTPSTSNSR